MYVLNPDDRKVEIEQTLIANVLYQPSYISLEYALNFYGLIPEAVSDVTSVSTRKTAVFINELGTFRYQHIDPGAFRGFKKVGEGQNAFFMAEAEKAVVDFLYLNLSRFQGGTKEILEQSYRFQNMETLKPKRMLELSLLFNNKKLNRIVKEFYG
jgi:predicted transcriptional regulator of viral defense system